MTDSQADFYSSVISEAQDFYAQKATGGKVTAKASSNVIMSLRKAAIHPLLSRHIYDDRRIDRIVAVLQKSDEFGGNPPDKIRAYITGDAAQSLKGGDYGIHRFCLERPILGKFALKRQEWMDCGKVLRFKELVTAYAASGDRVLVFSQFTTAMDILEQVLETLAVKFVRLDGSTKMDLRQELIDTFYNDTEITVFMLSTRAGGAGINLAAANKVIIFDSGFNPQDDVQAENRAHRVGQTREVEVVRLVTRGTIEEQIHALGESKLALDERVAGDASAASEDKAREKVGEQLVEKMLVEKLQDTQGDVPPVDADAKESKGKNKARPRKAEGPAASGNTSQETVKRAGGDLREAFRVGLEEKGVKVKSKQAVL
jgi:SWI/SNF-related matrix-associated actin-dependent regulator 1 of chromatin subfamily A